MDFLDPQKQRAHRIRLTVGYVLLAIAIGLVTTLLLYQAQGLGVKAGKVIQNGIITVDSTPGPAAIELNGRQVDNTNARLVLEAGAYTMRLSRPGYNDWRRALTVEGQSVEHYTYPFLVPKELKPVPMTTYPAVPPLVTQSPDRRWLLVQPAGQLGSFDQYDTKDPIKPGKPGQVRSQIAVPAALMTLPAAEPRTLEAVEWSNDNNHILLLYTAGARSEYIMFSRQKPAESVNLTSRLQLAPGLVLSLQDKKYDHYFIHDTAAHTLSTVTLDNPQPSALVNGVLAFKSYGSDEVIFASPDPQQAGRTLIKLYQGKRQYTVRSLAAGEQYLLAISRYDNAWYVMAGVPSENRVYIYRNPAESLQREPGRPLVPVSVLKLAAPANVAFSANSQLMMAQAGTTFAVYDAEYDRTYTYRMDAPLDAPQVKALWMDDHHLTYVSQGKTVLFDYDGTNLQTLTAQTPLLPPLYDTGHVIIFSVAKPETPGANAEAHVLSATPLRLPADY